MLARSRALAPGRRALPEEVCSTRLSEAEYSRLDGRPDPDLWEAAAAAWEDLHLPYRATYARWRQAEALLGRGAPADAAAVLRQAHRVALEVGAEPVRRKLELVAGRGDVELHHPATFTGR